MSSILRRYTNDTFDMLIKPTIGGDYGDKVIDVDGKLVKLEILDSAGGQLFKSYDHRFYRAASGVLLVYNVTRKSTFDHIGDWLKKTLKDHSSDINMVLVGTHCDDEHGREVETSAAQQFAEERGIPFFEVSSRDNVNVTESIEHLARVAKDRFEGTVRSTSVNDNHVEVDSEEKSTSKTRCNIL